MGIFHNSNGNDYVIYAIGHDKYGTPCALLERNGEWIAAWCVHGTEGSWGQGHYFRNDEEGAREFFAENYMYSRKEK